MRGERYIAPAAVLSAALALGATSCGGKSTCESLFNVSREYPGGARPDGVEIRTDLPPQAKEVEIGFTDPGDNWHDQWLPAGESNRIAMSIGPGTVRFRVRIKAVEGSQICGSVPGTEFVQKSYQEAVKKDQASIPEPSKFRLDERH